MTKTDPPPWQFEPDDISTSGNLTLVVARRAGKGLKGYKVSLHQDVATEFRKVCKETLTVLKQRKPRKFDPDLHMGDKEYMTVADAIVDVDASVRALLMNESALQFLAASQLPKQGFLFYSVLVGPIEARTAFIRKYNPRQIARGGKFWAVFGEDLRKLEDPIFVFDPYFDMVLTTEGLVVLSQNPFEAIFRDLSVMQDRLPDYVDHIASTLPMANDGAARFLAKCLQNSRVAKRARSIFERGHLAEVTMGQVKEEITRQNLDESKLIKNGQLIFDDADPYTLLKLLNEDLFIGGLSSTQYEADRKSAR